MAVIMRLAAVVMLLAACASPTPVPPSATVHVVMTTATPTPAATPAGTPQPTPTTDLTDRETLITVTSADLDQSYLLVGDYVASQEVHAGNKLCSTVVGAVESRWNGDWRSVDSLGHFTFSGWTLDSGGSGSASGEKAFFPRGTYKFVASPYGPFNEPQGNGQAALCEDWTLTLEAR